VNIELSPEELDRLADLVADKLADRFEQPKPWPPWMNVKTVAAYLDTTPGRIRKLVTRDAIPHAQDHKHGRVFFNRNDIDAWMTAKVSTRGNLTTPTGSVDVVS
jgi:hypothetical protein